MELTKIYEIDCDGYYEAEEVEQLHHQIVNIAKVGLTGTTEEKQYCLERIIDLLGGSAEGLLYDPGKKPLCAMVNNRIVDLL